MNFAHQETLNIEANDMTKVTEQYATIEISSLQNLLFLVKFEGCKKLSILS